MILTVYLGLGGIFKDRIIEEAYVVSAWDLHELYGTVARDFMHQKNQGIYTNAPTRGIANGLPEGGIGSRFTGTQYVRVPHDGAGYLWPGDEHARTLSLEAGAMDVIAFIRTSTNDATLRAIIQKHDVGSGTNGYHLALVDGQIEFFLRVAGVTIFSFRRGAVADNAWHIVQGFYRPDTGARIYIDGALSGATVATSGVEPATTTGDCRIGMFNDGAGGFIGDINYAVLGRNGSATISASLQATRAWSEITEHVRIESIQWTGGAPGVTHRDHTAGIGTFSFVLENRPVIGGVEVPGYYTIGHANQRAGFDLNIPVMVVATSGAVSRIVHRGRLAVAKPETGFEGSSRVYCMSEDWLAVAARTDVTRAAVLTNVVSSDAWSSLVDMADYPPVAVSVQTGAETFPFCFDRVDQSMLTEIAKIDQSEGGQTFIAADATTGGVLTFQNRNHRQTAVDPDITLTEETMHALEIEMGDARLINSVEQTITPRRLGASSTSVLYAQTKATPIPANGVILIEETYQDPAQSRSQIGAANVQPMVAGTDYNLTTADGGGSNINSSCTVELVAGGSGFRLRVTNTNAAQGWFTFQLRGQILYTDNPLTEITEDNALVRRHGLHRTSESYPYLDRMTTARYFADWLIDIFGLPIAIPSRVTVRPDPDDAQEQILITLGVGNMFSLFEELAAINPDTRYWSTNYRFSLTNQTHLEAQFGVIPSFTAGNDLGVWDDANALWDTATWAP